MEKILKSIVLFLIFFYMLHNFLKLSENTMKKFSFMLNYLNVLEIRSKNVRKLKVFLYWVYLYLYSHTKAVRILRGDIYRRFKKLIFQHWCIQFPKRLRIDLHVCNTDRGQQTAHPRVSRWSTGIVWSEISVKAPLRPFTKFNGLMTTKYLLWKLLKNRIWVLAMISRDFNGRSIRWRFSDTKTLSNSMTFSVTKTTSTL